MSNHWCIWSDVFSTKCK